MFHLAGESKQAAAKAACKSQGLDQLGLLLEIVPFPRRVEDVAESRWSGQFLCDLLVR